MMFPKSVCLLKCTDLSNKNLLNVLRAPTQVLAEYRLAGRTAFEFTEVDVHSFVVLNVK